MTGVRLSYCKELYRKGMKSLLGIRGSTESNGENEKTQ